MFLSRLRFNPRHPVALRALGDPYRMHQFIWSAFPDVEDGGPGRILFRVEPVRPPTLPTVLVQSEMKPCWPALVPPILLAEDGPKGLTPRFVPGERFRFRLRANPTKRTVHDRKRSGELLQKGMRVGLLKEDEQLNWFIDKAARHGFRVSEHGLMTEDAAYDAADNWFRVERKATWRGQRPQGQAGSRRDSRVMTWLAVDFEGILEVQNAEAFTKAVDGGIGSAKAFGFGLLSLAPPR